MCKKNNRKESSLVARKLKDTETEIVPQETNKLITLMHFSFLGGVQTVHAATLPTLHACPPCQRFLGGIRRTWRMWACH